MEENITPNSVNNTTRTDSPQVVIHIFEKDIVSKVHSEVGNAMSMVETEVQDAILTAMEKLVMRRVEQVLKSVNASSG